MEYQIPWVLHMNYDRKKREMTVIFSNHYAHTMQMDSTPFILNDNQIKEFVHKYDYRKLEYFTTASIDCPFDTLMRFKKPNQKDYIRTHAVCYLEHKNLYCIHFEEKDVFDFRRKAVKQEISEISSQIMIYATEEISKIESSYRLSRFTKQLNNLIFRDNNL